MSLPILIGRIALTLRNVSGWAEGAEMPVILEFKAKQLYMKRFFSSVCIVFLAFAALVVAPAQESFQQVQSRITEFTLANGLRFIILERHQAPVASFYTYVDAGSAQEKTGLTGLAHMFEHMAFKGTSTIGTKNYSEEKNSLERVDATFKALQKERDKGRKADPEAIKKLEGEF